VARNVKSGQRFDTDLLAFDFLCFCSEDRH
jgi:hypothetical protein